MSNYLKTFSVKLDNTINSCIETDCIFSQIDKLVNSPIVILDFRLVSHLRPIGVLMLINLCHQIRNKTDIKFVFQNTNEDIVQYLARINFSQTAKIDFRTEGDIELTDSENIWQEFVSFNNKIDTIKYVSDRYKLPALWLNIASLLETWLPGKRYEEERETLKLLMSELSSNSIEHSGHIPKTGSCYFMHQNTVDNSSHNLCFVVGDMGIGIKGHLSKLIGYNEKDDIYFIERVLNGCTGRLNRRGGMGYKKIQLVLSQLNGTMRLRSLSGAVIVNGIHTEFKKFQYSTLGTQCEIFFKIPKKYIDNNSQAY